MVYRVRFHLKTPIILSEPIHFDALLSAVHPAMHNNGRITSKTTPAQEMTQAPLSIDSVKIGEKWIWCCSAGEFADNATAFVDKFSRRKNDLDYHYMLSRQEKTAGIQKDLMETIYGVITPHIDFYVSTAKKGRMMHNIKRVNSIGSHREKGYGEVTSVEIDDTEYDFHRCLVHKSIAQRNIPSEFVVAPKTGLVYAYHPYWHSANMMLGVAVGDMCALKSEVWLNEAR